MTATWAHRPRVSIHSLAVSPRGSSTVATAWEANAPSMPSGPSALILAPR